MLLAVCVWVGGCGWGMAASTNVAWIMEQKQILKEMHHFINTRMPKSHVERV